MDKKQLQLGMNPSTAHGRLRMDMLYKLAVEAGHVCYRCSRPLTRETFSLEHKHPWLDSDNPKASFFDLANVAFSHQSCNYSAARKPHKRFVNLREKNAYHNPRRLREYDSAERHEKYLRTGN